MEITNKFEDAYEYESMDDASSAAASLEGHTGHDTRIDGTANGYVVRVITEDGDEIGWLK